MKQIPYTLDPDDRAGIRCEETNGTLKCHRRKNHPELTKTFAKIENDDENVLTVEFNHRALAAGQFYTW